jgi:hypothetical protein
MRLLFNGVLVTLMVSCSPSAEEAFCADVDEAVRVLRNLPLDGTRVDQELEQAFEQLQDSAGPFHGEQERDAQRVVEAFHAAWGGEPLALDEEFGDSSRDLMVMIFTPEADDYRAEWC